MDDPGNPEGQECLPRRPSSSLCSLNVQEKGFVEGSLVESDPARDTLSAAFKWSFGALADRSKPQGSAEEVAFG